MSKTKRYIKAARKGSREGEAEDETGFISKHSIHKSKKIYTRKLKHQEKPNLE